MSAVSSKGNEFGAFLGTLNNSSQPVFDLSQSAPTTSADQDRPSYDLLLKYLVTHDQPTTVGELADQTPVTLSALVRVLDSLSKANLVQVTRDGNKETVAITDIGRQIVNLGLR